VSIEPRASSIQMREPRCREGFLLEHRFRDLLDACNQIGHLPNSRLDLFVVVTQIPDVS